MRRVGRARPDREGKGRLTARTLIVAFALSLIPPTPAVAQEGETPESSRRFFTAISVRPGALSGDLALFVGGRTGWFVSERFSIGTGGYGLVTGVETAYTDSVPDARLATGYGGMELEYTRPLRGTAYYSLSLLLGGGEAHYRPDESPELSDTFFLWEPGFHFGLDMTDKIGFSAALLYRGVLDLDLSGFGDDEFTGFSGDITLRFFWF